MLKKDELVGFRISSGFKDFLQERADEKGISLTALIEDVLIVSFKKELFIKLLKRS